MKLNDFSWKQESIKETALINDIENVTNLKIIDYLPNDLSDIKYTFTPEIKTEYLNYEDFIQEFNIDEQEFLNLSKESVWEEPLLEILKTYNFLVNKFNNSAKKLSQIWLTPDNIAKASTKRLLDQVLEAWSSKRKLLNGQVVSLSKYSKEQYDFEKIWYYAFACTNVSLDIVKIKNDLWVEFTLREIDDILKSHNDEWWFFLPNSLWVSVNLMTEDENWKMSFIAQERNNTTTLTQRNRYVSSASWAVDYRIFAWNWDMNLMHNAIWEEIEEELWLENIKSNLDQKTLIQQIKDKVLNITAWKEKEGVNVLWKILKADAQNILWRELWLEAVIMPSILVYEEKRRNPEIVFIWKTWYNIKQIRQSWEKSISKDESLSIASISFDEIEEEIKNRIETWKVNLDNHFLMSFLWFLWKIKI